MVEGKEMALEWTSNPIKFQGARKAPHPQNPELLQEFKDASYRGGHWFFFAWRHLSPPLISPKEQQLPSAGGKVTETTFTNKNTRYSRKGLVMSRPILRSVQCMHELKLSET